MSQDVDFEKFASGASVLPTPWTCTRFPIMGADGVWNEPGVLGWTSGGFGIWGRAFDGGAVLFCLTHLRTGSALLYFVDLHDAARYADIANSVVDWNELESIQEASSGLWLPRWSRTCDLTRAMGYHRVIGLPVETPVPVLMLVKTPAPSGAVPS